MISSAAGQMGHLVGQIAKYELLFLGISAQHWAFKQQCSYFVTFFRNLGLRVLGYTGDGDKASWIKTDLNFDWAFNYKTQDINQTLNIAAPNGVIISEILSNLVGSCSQTQHKCDNLFDHFSPILFLTI